MKLAALQHRAWRHRSRFRRRANPRRRPEWGQNDHLYRGSPLVCGLSAAEGAKDVNFRSARKRLPDVATAVAIHEDAKVLANLSLLVDHAKPDARILPVEIGHRGVNRVTSNGNGYLPARIVAQLLRNDDR
jgi:hypothetical protein